MIRYLDVFAGAGGLSEGFLRTGYSPVAHIEMDRAACYTLKTRLAYQWLLSQKKENLYDQYLEGKFSRNSFYDFIPQSLLDTVLDYEISMDSLPEIFSRIDFLLKGKKLDLIVGGPPCQAYSLVGRARDKNKMVGDKRNYLYILYGKFIERYRPSYFVFENVRGLLSAKDRDNKLYIDKIRNLFERYGYTLEYKLLDAMDFGVPQKRKRIILIGKKNGNMDHFYPIKKYKWPSVTVSEILADLPPLHAGQGTAAPVKTLHYDGNYLYEAKIKRYDMESVTFHCARPHTTQDLEIYRRAVQEWENSGRRINYLELPERLRTQHNNRSFLDRFKVVAGNLDYSQTIVAHIARDGHYFIHPDIMQNRSLTPREAARLQTFPDNYYFESVSGKPSRTSAFKQIGNAVPVLLAEAIARHLLQFLK
jgi:DNA (cytosine-5)-methyltransferase 1